MTALRRSPALLSAAVLAFVTMFARSLTSQVASGPLEAAPTILITDPPFSASPSGAVTARVSVPVPAGVTALPISSCESFRAGNGVLVAHAGASGANYVGTVQACSGTTLRISPATGGAVALGFMVEHDETAAFQQAIAAVSRKGGRIIVPRGNFRINGALQDPAGANAILKMPNYSYQSQAPVIIRITGTDKPAGAGGYDANAPTLQTEMTGGALIGGYFSGSTPYPPFTNIWLDIENIQIVGYNNPDFVAVDAHAIAAFQGHHLACSPGPVPITDPTHTHSECIRMPSILNNNVNELDDIFSVGFYNGFTLAEHTVAGAIHAVSCHNGFIFDNGSNPTAPKTYLGNAIYAAHLDTLYCHNGIVGGATATPIYVASADLELTQDFSIFDPENRLLGIVNYNQPYSSFGSQTQFDPIVRGAANLMLYNLRSPNVRFGGGPGVNASGGSNGTIGFYANSPAANATITNDRPGQLSFNVDHKADGVVVRNPAGVAGSQVASSLASSYAVHSVGDYPNWAQSYLFNSAYRDGGVASPYRPGRYLLRADSGVLNGIAIDAAAPRANIDFFTEDLLRGRIFAGGGLALGSTRDPGPGNISAGAYRYNAGEEALTSTTAKLSPGIPQSTIALQSNYRFTLEQGSAGTTKCLTFIQPVTGGPYTVSPPATVLGFTPVGTAPGKHSTQCFIASDKERAWLPTSAGVQNY